MIFIGKKEIKSKDKVLYFYSIAWLGVIHQVSVTQDEYNNCPYQVGAVLDDKLFSISCYTKGFDNVIKLSFK